VTRPCSLTSTTAVCRGATRPRSSGRVSCDTPAHAVSGEQSQESSLRSVSLDDDPPSLHRNHSAGQVGIEERSSPMARYRPSRSWE
jgi:hypothetical protein